MTIEIGQTVTFAPNPRFPDKFVTARVIHHRHDPRSGRGARPKARFGHESGWLDTIDAMGVKRSVRASRCRDAQPSPASTPTPKG